VPADSQDKTSFDYCDDNLRKCLGHVFRAGYDALDILVLDVTTEIVRYFTEFRVSTLIAAMPSYVKEVRQPFATATALANEAKANKDVEASVIDLPNFRRYEEALVSLHTISSLLQQHLPQIEEIEQERRREDENNRNNLRQQRNLAVGGFVVTVIFGLLGIVFAVTQMAVRH
jgi:hypothetical protein